MDSNSRQRFSKTKIPKSTVKKARSFGIVYFLLTLLVLLLITFYFIYFSHTSALGDEKLVVIAKLSSLKPKTTNENTELLHGEVVPTIIPTIEPTNIPQKQLSKPVPAKSQQKGSKKQSNKKQPNYNIIYDFESDWAAKGELKYIQMLPTPKIMLKKDRRVIFPNITIHLPTRSQEPATNVVGSPRELLKANQILQRHPLFTEEGKSYRKGALEETMVFIKQSPYCAKKPIFLSMATVKDDLYWQLIENFVYTMVKFGTSECALVICVSDPNCMKMCDGAFFPCFDYQEAKRPLPSVMEQIAAVKLLHTPKALARGVDVFMLDLDVGFLEDPNHMVQVFEETPIVDILVQEDYIFIMNRTKAGWKSWFTEPLPNIGLFLCRGNNRTVRVFEIAWEKYLKMDDAWEKAQPGKDQNHVLDAMRIGRGTFGLKYAYFDNKTAPLLDKLVLNYGNVMELGGEMIEHFLDSQKSIAMHTTCYEKSTKVMGLKATNAFWNPRYYDPLRPTLTKPIIYIDEKQLLDEVRSLVWLGLATDRSIIVPNILGPEDLHTIDSYQGQTLWPGFRVVFLKRNKGRNDLKIEILEPAYYWRVERDYDAAPQPYIIYYGKGSGRKGPSLQEIQRLVAAASDHPRIVLHQTLPEVGIRVSEEDVDRLAQGIVEWANHSVAKFAQPYSTIRRTYLKLPSVKDLPNSKLKEEVLQGMRNCANIFGPSKGNRTCFQICD